jgi:ABC-2 type transport system permease protein
MPSLVQDVMLAAPTTHFVTAARAILYRGAGLDVVWPPFLALAAIGAVFFGIALTRFRRTISAMARLPRAHRPPEDVRRPFPAAPRV